MTEKKPHTTIRFPEDLNVDLNVLATLGRTSVNQLLIDFARRGIAAVAATDPKVAATLAAAAALETYRSAPLPPPATGSTNIE